MADTLPDLVARLKAAVPALADVPVDVLAAEVVRQVQARGGPSVGDVVASEPSEPTFRTSNLKTPAGNAVVRDAPSPWTKAATIGAAPADVNRSALRVALGEIQAPWRAATVGAAPRSEQLGTAEHGLWSWLAGTLPGTVGDALGVTQFRGKAQELEHPAPITASILQDVPGATSVGEVLAGERGLYSRVDDAVSLLPKKGAHPNKIAGILKSNSSAEELAALYDAPKGTDLRPAALRELGPATWRRGTEGRYAPTVLTGRDADRVMQAIENVGKRFPALKKAIPEMEQALRGMPASPGTWAEGIIRDPDTGLILPTPDVIGRWARYGLYGEEIPANWGPLTQPGIVEAFGPDASREIKLYSDLWGAISPLNDPMVNTVQANRAYGRTLGPKGFSPMAAAEFTDLGLGLPSRLPNINRSMAGEPLSGPKVPRMSGMLEGTERLPPLDEHVTTASGGASGKWASELPALRARVTAMTGDEFTGPAGELRLNKLLSEGLVEMWSAMYPDRPPLESMAASWEGIRSDKGIKSVGGPYNILRRLGLGEKNAMLDPARLAAKWPGGYISSAVLLPLLLERWHAVMAAQPEQAPDASPTGAPAR